MKKKIVILGSTGSIGTNTIDVVENNLDEFEIVGLTAGRNVELLAEQVRKIKPKYAGIADEDRVSEFQRICSGSSDFQLFKGEKGLQELVRNCDADLIVNALVGSVGLVPTLAALERKIPVALANKETMVIGGEVVSSLARKNKTDIFPIDSEHSALWQCLTGESPGEIRRIILTASGGPFLHKNKEEFGGITVGEALAHPNWKMGKKITIDSATMMNKGFEVIEAHWLFDVPPGKIDIVIHPQSIIHSMIEFIDGSVKAQMGLPDMRIPIQYAMTYPKRVEAPEQMLDFKNIKELTFLVPDREKFPCISLAYSSLETGGTMPAVLNAANEAAVSLFLQEKIGYQAIYESIERTMENHRVVEEPNLEELLEADRWARNYVCGQCV